MMENQGSLVYSNSLQRLCIFCLGLEENKTDNSSTLNSTDFKWTAFLVQYANVLAPVVFLLLFAPIDLHFARISKFSNIPWGFHNISRLVFIVLLVIHSGTDLVIGTMSTSSNVVYSYWVTPAIRVVTFTITGVLTLMHRKHGIISSGMMTMFWLFYTLLAIPKFYNHITSSLPIDRDIVSFDAYYFVSDSIHMVILAVLVVLHLFSDQRPSASDYKNTSTKSTCPELHAGFLRRIFFFWFDSVMWQRFRRHLTNDDLFDIRPEDMLANIYPRFERNWKLEVAKKSTKASTDRYAKTKNTNGNLVPVLFKTFGETFYLATLLKFLCDILSFVPSQILSLLITFTLVPTIPKWNGFVLTVALPAIFLLIAFLNNQLQYLNAQTGYRIRSVLVNAIYRKSLTLSGTARSGTTHGEIVTLMSVDAQQFVELIIFLHIVWSGPLVLAICMYFLYDLLGVSAFAGLITLILLVPINSFIAAKLKYFQLKQMEKKAARIRTMNEILSGIKVLKLYAWEESFEAAMQTIRNKELQSILHADIASAFMHLMWNMVPTLVTLVTFVTFVYSDETNKVTPNNVFVALSLINVLRVPLTVFPLVVSQLMQAWVAVIRINQFLNQEDCDEDGVSHCKSVSALEIKDGDFTWTNCDALVLKQINMAVCKGDLAAVVGPVGCGKTSLVLSFLGETVKRYGSTVNVDGSIAYVPQQAWIQNATLQDNILFGLPMEPTFYQTVLEACALLPDLDILPSGDRTEIGEKGINLSGGQKQRVALARAVYSRAQIYLLDDPLSAVDAHVGKHIFDHVIGPAGLLHNKTRLLVTHHISFLPQTNHIFVMVNGKISETGYYEELLQQNGAFAEFLMKHMQNVSKDDEEDISPGMSIAPQKISNATVELPSQPVIAIGTKIIKSEALIFGSEGLTLYLLYIRNVGLWFTVACVIGLSLTKALAIYANTWLSEWSTHPGANEPNTRSLYLGAYAAISALQGLAIFLSYIYSAFGARNAARVLHNKMLHTTMRLPMSFFDTTPLGRISNRFTKDMDVIDNGLPRIIRVWLTMLFATIGILVVVCISTPIFIGVMIPLAVAYYFLQRIYVVTSRQLRRIESITQSPIHSHFGETISGHTTIRAFGVENRFRSMLESHLDENQKSAFESTVATRWLSIRLEFIGGVAMLFAALFAVLARDSISSELVGMSITYVMQITWSMSLLVRFTADVETFIVAVERVEEYAKEPTEAAWETDERVALEWPTEGAVRFENVDLRYRDGMDLVLNDVSFEIGGGEKIGIVGRTGAGKSSLTVALFRIVEAVGGRILIDGVPTHKLGLQVLRSRLTIIPQDPVLFDGTLRGNIDPFCRHSDEEVWAALDKSHLKSFVEQTSSGLMHIISEGGENLSSGQRQLVCLARALLRKSKLLILDEATAAINLDTDNLIQATIREAFKDCTVLTIAHRLNTILDSDRVMVMDMGKVVELDKPAALLSDPESRFFGMAHAAGIVVSPDLDQCFTKL